MSVTETIPQMTATDFNAKVQAYLSGLGFATQTELDAKFAQVNLPPVPYNVPQSLLSLGNGVLAGVPATRNMTLTSYTYKLISLVGVNALLSIEIRKNGVVVPGTAVNVNTGNLNATVVLGTPIFLVAGDYIELWRTSLAGVSPIPGGMYGTFILT